MEATRRDVLIGGAASAIVAAGAGLAAAPPDVTTPAAALPGSLKGRAEAKGMFYGAAISAKTLANPRFNRAVLADCDIVVPENALKWQATEHDEGKFVFTEAEQLWDFASSNGLKMRGHNLLWYSGYPRWLPDAAASLSRGKLAALIEDYVTTVVGHWRGRLVHWDVVNEAVLAPDLLTKFAIADKLGEHYIDIAFHAARAADPGTLLVLNQSAIESDEPSYLGRRTGTLRLLERLLKRGVPVQALGIESHLRTALPFTQRPWADFLAEVSGMGLKFIVTEFDIADNGFSGPPAERDRLSAQWTQSYLDVCFANRACLGMLSWTQTDWYSWLAEMNLDPRADGQKLRPGLLDADFNRKPLWAAVANAFEHAPAR